MEITQKSIAEFAVYLKGGEKSENTVKKYVRDIKAFFAWCDGRSVDKEIMLSYKKYLIEKYAPVSVNAAISSLNCFLDFMRVPDLKLKTVKIQRSIYASAEKELTKEEYERLLSAAKDNKRLYCLIQTICSSGIRVSELSYITYAAVLKGFAIINNKGKMRKVFLPKKLCVMLKKYAKEQGITSGSIFVTRNKKPMDRSNIWKMLKALCKAAKVAKEKVFPHNLRHLFARTFYKIQKDIVRLADILGHSSINTTRIYTMTTGEEHRKQIDKLNLLRC